MKQLATYLILLALVVGCASSQDQQKDFKTILGTTHDGQTIEIHAQNTKAIVVTFLSSKCPCSNSNSEVLVKLASKYPQYSFVGIHSNADEDRASAKKYFESKQFNFPVIYDEDSTLAKRFGALKTPHVFIVSSEGKIIYNGSVTSSTTAHLAKEIYLDIALSEISAGKMPSTPKKKTLGCYIKLKG